MYEFGLGMHVRTHSCAALIAVDEMSDPSVSKPVTVAIQTASYPWYVSSVQYHTEVNVKRFDF